MEYNYDKCPECGYTNKNRPDVCPSCGCDWASYREELRKKQEAEWKQQAEEARIDELNNAYTQAIGLFNNGSYKEALNAFMALGEYKDSGTFADKCREAIYQQLIENFNSNAFLKNLMTREESCVDFQTPFVQSCREKYKPDDFKKIKKTFKGYENYKQTSEYMACCDLAVELYAAYNEQEARQQTYSQAVEAYNDKRYKNALTVFKTVSGYLDADELAEKCQEAMYQYAVALFNAGSYANAIEEFGEIPNYKESADYIRRSKSELSRIKQERAEKRQVLEAEQTEENRKNAMFHIAICALAPVLCVIFGIILFLNKEQISIVSSFGWWCFGWIVFALVSIYIAGVSIPGMLKDYKNLEYYKLTSGERKKRSIIIAAVAIICAVVVIIGSAQLNFKPTECVSIAATDKEDTIAGKYYDTVITFELQNDSNVQVTYINGEMVFYNGETEVATYNVYFNGEYDAGESYKTTVEFHDKNSALYDVSFENLKITYRITSMKFNGEYNEREYDGKAITIKELS